MSFFQNPFREINVNPLLYSVFNQDFDEPYLPPFILGFKLLDGEFFHLLNGEQFELLG